MAGVQDAKEGSVRPLTRSHDEGLREDLQKNAGFRKSYLRLAVGSMIGGEIDLGKHMLRKYINATVGFIELGEALGRSSKTLMQMLGPKGNPHIRNFFEIVAYLQQAEGATFEVVLTPKPKKRVKTSAKHAVPIKRAVKTVVRSASGRTAKKAA